MPEAHPGHLALGAWSGGRHLHFGDPISEERLVDLLTPDGSIHTIITADAYGAGEADELVGRALQGTARDAAFVIGAVGHDFYEGQREGAKGFPRFTDPRLRGPGAYAGYLQMATERSLQRCGLDRFDVLLLHNPDRTGYESETVWNAMAGLREQGLTDAIGVAPGPANGFTLDIVACLQRFGALIDWAMVILNPFEPWPGELVLPACVTHEVDVIARVVDYGGLFWDDVKPGHRFAERDHRLYRPAGWVEAGQAKLERVRPIAERHELTMIQLAAQWVLAHEPVRVVAPTLIQEPEGQDIEAKRAELAATPVQARLTDAEIAEVRAIGDNYGSMALKGASPDFTGDALPDRWPLTEALADAGALYGIDAHVDLVGPSPAPAR